MGGIDKCCSCGTTLFRTGESFPNTIIMKVGIMDDPEWPNRNVPKGELFVGERVKMHGPLEGADQVQGMP